MRFVVQTAGSDSKCQRTCGLRRTGTGLAGCVAGDGGIRALGKSLPVAAIRLDGEGEYVNLPNKIETATIGVSSPQRG